MATEVQATFNLSTKTSKVVSYNVCIKRTCGSNTSLSCICEMLDMHFYKNEA